MKWNKNTEMKPCKCENCRNASSKIENEQYRKLEVSESWNKTWLQTEKKVRLKSAGTKAIRKKCNIANSK